MVQPTLPQNDRDPGTRKSGLERARGTYRFAHDWPPGVATLADLPADDDYSLLYNLKIMKVYAEVGLNLAAMAFDGLETGAVAELIEERFTRPTPSELHQHIFTTPQHLAQKLPPIRPESWRDFERFFEVWPTPDVTRFHQAGGADLDLAFAWQRIAGCNPMVLQRCAKMPDHLRVDAGAYAGVIDGDSLEAALTEHRLYLADYGALADVASGETDGLTKYLAAPMALFAVDPSTKALRPVAIQMGQTPDAALFTPADGWRWRMAMAHVQIADANMHEGVFHLGRTHLVMEAVNVAMRRQLSERHPLYLLLHAHLETTFAINHSAKTSLIAPGGTVDRCFSPSIEAFASVVKQALDSYPLEQASPLADLERRGLDDAEALPNHPYRDDVKLVWDAVTTYVADYVSLYYPTNEEVTSDGELQAFVAEIGAGDGGALPGVPKVSSVAELTAFVSKLVYIAGPGHSAVNFAQYPFMGLTPNMTGASFSPVPTADSPDDEATYTAMLPPMHVALEGVTMIFVLSNARATTFGHYEPFYFRDRRVGEAVRRLQARLEGIEDVIEERNASRLIPYPFLQPSQILQSISI